MSLYVANIRSISNGHFRNFFSDEQGAGLLQQHPNLEEQAIFDQGILPLALDTPVSNSKAEALSLARPGYFISPVPSISGEKSPIRQPGRRPMED
jgi:hypothetical protein